MTRAEIRPAYPKDSAAIAVLLGQLGYPTEAGDVADRLGRLRATGMAEVLVATVDGTVAGCASLHWLDLLHGPGRIGRITSLVVDAPWRSRSIGAQLVAAAETVFHQQGCLRVEVTSGIQRSRAHAFYASLGYEFTARRYSKHLTAG